MCLEGSACKLGHQSDPFAVLVVDSHQLSELIIGLEAIEQTGELVVVVNLLQSWSGEGKGELQLD
jgi:hypothetical protein